LKSNGTFKRICQKDIRDFTLLLIAVAFLVGSSKEPTIETDLGGTALSHSSKTISPHSAGTVTSATHNNKSGRDGPFDRNDTSESPINLYSAHQLLDEFVMLAMLADSSQAKELERLRVALHGLGYNTLQAIRSLINEGSGDALFLEGGRAQALLDILLVLGLPEVEGVALEWLNNEPSAAAVVQIGRYLARHAPGRYDLEIRLAAENALLLADQSDESLGPLYQLLGEFGDEKTVALLLNMPRHRDAYSSVALAMIPDGSGIPLLEQDARLVESGLQTVHGRLAIELLAQQAHQFEDAAAIVLDLADQGLIPPDIWPQVLAIVSGERQFTLNPTAQGLVGSYTIFSSKGDQTLYLVTGTAEQDQSDWAEWRILMLEELLQLAPDLKG
jgi:hypothetical protein